MYNLSIIQSFVVQNFSKIYVLTESSIKRVPTICLKYRSFIFTNLVYNTNLFTKYFKHNPFFMFNLFSIKSLNYSSYNLLKSLLYKFFKYLLEFTATKTIKHSNNLELFYFYKNNVKLVKLPVYKNKINQLLYTTLNVLLLNSYINVTRFSTPSADLIYNFNFNFYMFINLFYFKIRHL